MITMSSKNIILEINEGIAFITINRPGALNALNEALLDELIDVFINVKKNVEVKAIILTGKGKAFISGADIAEMNKLTPVEGRALMMKGHSVMTVSYTHLRAHETRHDLVCRLLLEKKKKKNKHNI